MSKKYKKSEKVNVTNAYGLDAGAYSPNRSFNTFPTVSRRDITAHKRNKIISRARSLYYNSPEVRSAVKTLGMLVGNLKPMARSTDKEWNKLAEEAFMRRVSNPASFELTGTLNFNQLQTYIEDCANVDGDVLIVLTTGKDGAGVAVYPADMIGSDIDGVNDGVELDSYGRVTYYHITSKEKEIRIPAKNCILYRHNPDPTDPRGLTELIAAITTAQDIYEINSYNKQSVKLGASFGIVETVDNNVKRTDVSDLKMLRNGGQSIVTDDQPVGAPLTINGVNAVTLSPGHDLKTLQDNRPSNEVRSFAKDLVDSIALSIGLDPEILYRVKEMGSSSVRFSIAKTKDWSRPRMYDKQLVCDRIWRHIIAYEVASGRLRTCNDMESMYDVQWIGTGCWSIDRGRDASSAIALIREGLMSRDQYCLENYGMTFEEITNDNLNGVKNMLEQAQKMGVPLQVLIPGQAGSTPYTDDQFDNNEEDNK